MPVIGFLHPRSPDGRGASARIPPGPEGSWLYRGRERRDRIPLGRGSNGSAAGAGGRIGSPTGRRDRRARKCQRVRGQGGNHDDPHRLHRRRRPGQAWSCRQPRPAGRQPDGDQFFQRRVGSQSGWSSCANWCPQPLVWPCSSIRPTPDAETTLRDAERGCARYGAANPSPQRQHQPRDQCGLRNFCARAARRLFVAVDPFFTSRRVQIGHIWRRVTRSPRHMRGVNMPKSAG